MVLSPPASSSVGSWSRSSIACATPRAAPLLLAAEGSLAACGGGGGDGDGDGDGGNAWPRWSDDAECRVLLPARCALSRIRGVAACTGRRAGLGTRARGVAVRAWRARLPPLGDQRQQRIAGLVVAPDPAAPGPGLGDFPCSGSRIAPASETACGPFPSGVGSTWGAGAGRGRRGLLRRCEALCAVSGVSPPAVREPAMTYRLRRNRDRGP